MTCRNGIDDDRELNYFKHSCAKEGEVEWSHAGEPQRKQLSLQEEVLEMMCSVLDLRKSRRESAELPADARWQLI